MFVVLASLVALRAAASPLEDPTLGGAVFTGPVHPHATAMYLNPGALGLVGRGTHLYLDGSLRLDRYDLRRLHLTDPDQPAGLASQGQLGTMSPSGTLVWYNVGRTVSIGAALSLVTLERYIDERDLDAGEGVVLGYHALGGSHRQYVWRNIGPLPMPLPMPTLAGSYRFNERMLFGIGISLRYSSLELAFLRDTALEGGSAGIDGDCDGSPCGIENPAAAERYHVEVDSPSLLTTKNLVLNVGVMYQLARDWWLGAHYQSPPGFLSSLSATGTACIAPRGQLDAAPCGDADVQVPAELVYELPQTLSVGLRGPAVGGFDGFAAFRWQNLSRHRRLDIRLQQAYEQSQDIPEWYPRYRGFDDVFVIEGGVEQREGGRVRVGARLRLESAAVPEQAISPMQMDGGNLTAAVGGEIRLTEGLFLSVGYGLTFYPEADISVDESLYDPRDRLACVDTAYHVDACAGAVEGRAIPTAAGTYDRIRHAFRLAVRYHFLTR